MKYALRSHQHLDLYRKYHAHDSKISGALGKCGSKLEVPAKEAVPVKTSRPLGSGQILNAIPLYFRGG